ncbi:MAG: 7-carboxy-7-deazaguanine synthase QueE [Bacteriovoracaceae bacterium]|nr:7-carboxy-7-deazaguanine synthase QueE [Bacteriovoracaceae bacterium]
MTAPLLALNKIYLATEGEGINVGLPEILVRLQGCAIACANCDTPAALAKQSPKYQVDQVLAQIQHLGLKRVSLTGGDPLAKIQRPGVMALGRRLKERGYWINLEAHGLTPLEDAAEVYDLVDFISADFKTPSCGHPGSIAVLRGLLQNYAAKLQIKSVIVDENDLNFVQKAYQACQPWPAQVTWTLTPAYDLHEALPQNRIARIYKWNCATGGKFRVIVQQHKLVFGPQRDDV